MMTYPHRFPIKTGPPWPRSSSCRKRSRLAKSLATTRQARKSLPGLFADGQRLPGADFTVSSGSAKSARQANFRLGCRVGRVFGGVSWEFVGGGSARCPQVYPYVCPRGLGALRVQRAMSPNLPYQCRGDFGAFGLLKNLFCALSAGLGRTRLRVGFLRLDSRSGSICRMVRRREANRNRNRLWDLVFNDNHMTMVISY